MPNFERPTQNSPEKPEQSTEEMIAALDQAIEAHDMAALKASEEKAEPKVTKEKEKKEEKKVEKPKENKKESKRSGRIGTVLKAGTIGAAGLAGGYVGYDYIHPDKEGKAPPTRTVATMPAPTTAPEVVPAEKESENFLHIGDGFRKYMVSTPEDAPGYDDVKFEIPTTSPSTQPETQPEVVIPPAIEKTPEQIQKEKAAADLAKSRAKDKEMHDKMDNLIKHGLPHPVQAPNTGKLPSKERAATAPTAETKPSTQPEKKVEKETKEKEEKIPSRAKWSQKIVEKATIELTQVQTTGDAKEFVRGFFRDFERSYDDTRSKDIKPDEAAAMGKYAEEMKSILIGVCDKYGFEKDKNDIEKEFKQISNDTKMKQTYEWQKQKENDKKLKGGNNRR